VPSSRYDSFRDGHRKPNETTAKGERLVTSSGILCKKEIEPPELMGAASSGSKRKKGIAVAPMRP